MAIGATEPLSDMDVVLDQGGRTVGPLSMAAWQVTQESAAAANERPSSRQKRKGTQWRKLSFDVAQVGEHD